MNIKRPFIKPRRVLLWGTLALVFLEFFVLHSLQSLDNRLSDFFIKSQASAMVADQDIVIIDIDEPSLASMNHVAGRWPWPRAIHGDLLEGIRKQSPKAILFDIWFVESDKVRPQSDAAFNQVLAKTPHVYLPMLRLDEKDDAEGTPLSELKSALWGADGKAIASMGNPTSRVNLLLPKAIDPANWRLGVINFIKDADGVGRRYYVNYPVEGWQLPSLPARVAQDLGYPLPQGESVVLSWRSPTLSFPRIAYADLYTDFKRDAKWRDPHELRDKIVIIGATAEGLYDMRPTPLDSVLPGVKLLATAMDNFKNQRTMTVASPWLLSGVTAALVLVLYYSFRYFRNVVKNSFLVLFILVVFCTSSYVLIPQLYLLPVLTSMVLLFLFYLGSTLLDILRERRDKEHAVTMFSRFVNPHVVQELIASGGLARGGERRQVTLLFSDIRGFTSLSETRSPEEVVALLNDYFSMQVGVIFKHDGALDKFIGDAIMAFWGAPLDDEKHAEHAIAAALEMYERVCDFKVKMGETGLVFDVGIGLHSGPAVVGLIGSEQRREYTAIGDTVNLASRIEGLTRGIAPVLVSEDTMKLCPQAFDFIDHGSHPVKGRLQDVRLFEPRRK
jgi:adenylate cyclase